MQLLWCQLRFADHVQWHTCMTTSAVGLGATAGEHMVLPAALHLANTIMFGLLVLLTRARGLPFALQSERSGERGLRTAKALAPVAADQAQADPERNGAPLCRQRYACDVGQEI